MISSVLIPLVAAPNARRSHAGDGAAFACGRRAAFGTITCTSAGLDIYKLKAALQLILRELRSICEKRPGEVELKKARDYAAGITLMGLESTTNQIMWMGESLLGYGRSLDPAEVERAIAAVTAEEIQGVACHCLNRGRFGVAIVGPLKDAHAVERWIA